MSNNKYTSLAEVRAAEIRKHIETGEAIDEGKLICNIINNSDIALKREVIAYKLGTFLNCDVETAGAIFDEHKNRLITEKKIMPTNEHGYYTSY